MPFAFGDYVLDPERRELMRGTAPVAVGPKVFDLLLFLVRNRDRVVSKDDLLAAVWGGRIVSESTLTSHINAVRKAVGDTGANQHVVRTMQRKGFRFVAEVRDGPPVPALPDKPSIAVLPFKNLSGDLEQEYFAEGVVEDVITALSRIRWLFVIARNSSFAFKDRAVDVAQIGRRLGVRYVLEGSVRRAADRVRITGQLVDAASGAHIWAERFEGAADDIFALQDQVAASVAGAIAPELERAEIELAKRKPTESLGAYDYYLRAMAHVHRGSREAVDQALPLFRQAIAADRDFAAAHGMAAWCHLWRKVNGWLRDPAAELAEGLDLARRAVELGRDDAVALTRGAHALGHFTGDLAIAVAALDRSLLLNPNLAATWFLGGYLRIWLGESEAAQAHFARAMRLSPLDPELFRMQAGVAMAHLFAGRFDEASSWAAKAAQNLPSFLLAVGVLAASHAQAGRAAEAARAMEQLRALDPGLRVGGLRGWLPIHRPADLATLADGLRKAGLPE